MIEHFSLQVKQFDKAKKFYLATLKPLGYKNNMSFDGAAGFMEGGHTSFWIVNGKPGSPIHVAFRAKSKKAVQDFHKAALKAGGKDNGKPGLRTSYSPDYYAAFAYDLERNNIEAVWYDPKLTKKRR